MQTPERRAHAERVQQYIAPNLLAAPVTDPPSAPRARLHFLAFGPLAADPLSHAMRSMHFHESPKQTENTDESVPGMHALDAALARAHAEQEQRRQQAQSGQTAAPIKSPPRIRRKKTLFP